MTMGNRIRALGALAAAGLIGVALGAASSGVLRAEHETSTSAVAQTAPVPAPAPGTPLGLDTFQGIAHRDDSAVVNIGTSKVIHEARLQDPFFQFFGQGGAPFAAPFGHGGDETLTQRSLGSGFIVDKDGFVLTNRHVVDDADEITVTLTNGHHYKAKTVGEDARTDIALLKIEPREPLTTLPLGDSEQTRVGEWVMAIGNPFGLGGNSVTVGVVSFKGRPLDLSTRGTPVEMLQTDAAINPGNSGGPLINARGEAVGINTLIMTGGAQQYSGVGFAVPINVARDILPQLRDKGHVTRGWLGVQIQNVDEDLAKSLKMDDTKGAIVSDVTAGSPAAKAGLEPGDVVLSVDGQPVDDASDLSAHVSREAPESKMSLDVLRDGKQKTLHATLGSFPDEAMADSAAGGTDHGYLGIAVQTLTPDLARSLGIPADTHGAVVAQVEPGGRADSAGLQERDVIVSVNGTTVADAESLKASIAGHENEILRLRVRRGNGYLFLVVKPS